MKRWIFGAVAALAIVGNAAAETPVERGNYLVNSILTCGNCHTPRGPGGVFDMSKQLSGGPQTFDEPAFKVKGANITPDMETGIGKWSVDDIKHLLLTGKRPDGVSVAPIMPYGFYKVFMPSDLDAIAAYLKSVPPIRNQVEPSVYRTAAHADGPAGSEKAMSEADMSNPVKRGFYLATVGHCMECHTPIVEGRHQFSTSLGKGNQEFKGPWGSVLSRNITQSKTAGIGAWSDDEIKTAITTGVGKDGTRLKGPMAFSLYAKMTPADLSAVVAYLRTVPALD